MHAQHTGDDPRALTLCETAEKEEGGGAYEPGPGGTSPVRSSTVSWPSALRTAPASHELRLLGLACGSRASRGLAGGRLVGDGDGASLPPGHSGVAGA